VFSKTQNVDKLDVRKEKFRRKKMRIWVWMDGCKYQFTSYYRDPHPCTHLPRINKTSICTIDNVYKGKTKKTELIKMENKTTQTRLREKFPFGKDIYMKLYMDDSVI
jgi:hypothetical protein